MKKEGKGQKANPMPVVGVWPWRYWWGRAGGFKSYGSPSWHIMLHLSYLARGSTTRGDHWYANAPVTAMQDFAIYPAWLSMPSRWANRWEAAPVFVVTLTALKLPTICPQLLLLLGEVHKLQATVKKSGLGWYVIYICFVCGCSRRLCVSNVDKLKVMTALWFKLLGMAQLAFYSTPGQERTSSKWSAKCSSRSCCEF